MNVPFLDLQAQYRRIRDEADAAVRNVVERSAFVLGEAVEAFERDFAATHGAPHAIAVNSGTSALHLALLAAGVGAGDEVITVPFTFIATQEAISMAGATPVLVDVDERTLTMDAALLDAAVTPRTKAVIPVHLYGQPADMEPIRKVAAKRGLAVIEDACQAHLAAYRGATVGSLGDAACFSFYPGKNLGAWGEGGAVLTKRADWAERMRRLRDHGQSEKYRHAEVGFNYRMEGIQGAVLGVKLKHLPRWTDERRERAAWYTEGLAGLPIRLVEEAEGRRHVYHLFVVRHERRDALQKHLSERGVGSGLHYPVPVHLQAAYASMGWKRGQFPVSERAAQEVLSLPMFPELAREQVDYVCAAVRDFFRA